MQTSEKIGRAVKKQANERRPEERRREDPVRNLQISRSAHYPPPPSAPLHEKSFLVLRDRSLFIAKSHNGSCYRLRGAGGAENFMGDHLIFRSAKEEISRN